MGSSARTAAGLAVALLLLLPAGCNQEGASAEDGLGIDLEKARKAAQARTPDDVEIDWYGGSLTKTRALKQLGRQMRNLDKPVPRENFEKLTVLAIEHGDPELLATGYFGRAYLEAEKLLAGNVDPEKVVDMVVTAVDLGYRNIREIRQADVFQPLYDLPRFRNLMRELEKEQSEEIRASIREEIDEELRLSRKIARRSWSPELETLGGESIWRYGRPMLVVVSRIHHDGFNKLSPLLHEVQHDHPELPVAIAFYQYDEENPARVSQTREYVRHLGVEIPAGIMGREEYRELMDVLEARHDALREARAGEATLPFNPFQPLGLFLDAERTPLYVTRGVIAEWEFRHVVKSFLEVAGAPPPSPDGSEAPEQPAKPEKPAEEPPRPEGGTEASVEASKAETVEPKPAEPAGEPKPAEPEPAESEPTKTGPEETEPKEAAPDDAEPDDREDGEPGDPDGGEAVEEPGSAEEPPEEPGSTEG